MKIIIPSEDADADRELLDYRTSSQYSRALDQRTLLFNQDLERGRPGNLQDLSRILGRTCK